MTARGPSRPGSPSIEARLAKAGLRALPRTAWLEIDLDALCGNLAALRDAVDPGVRVEPVVKADAYGHGSIPIARALEAAGADGLSVATFDEAWELREAGIRLPLLVLYPVPVEHAPAAARAGIALSTGAGLLLDRLLAAVAGMAAGDPAWPVLEVHLEIETGLIEGAGHASATGRFDDEQLFYLRSRGIAEDEARRLVVHGFFNDLIRKIGVPSLEEQLTGTVEAELAKNVLRDASSLGSSAQVLGETS